MKQDKRVIVRRRTQQLVYLELGRENGGVMLNLSEEGCGFQAITPVKCGETRFGFQINGGRRIAGDAEVVWADDSGIMGGLRFLNLPAEAHKEIRLWLEETNAPEEHGFAPVGYAPVAAATVEAAAQRSRASGGEDLAGRNSGVRLAEQEAPPSPAWANLRAGSYSSMEDDRYRAAFQREDLAFGRPPRSSAAVWRGIAAVATVVALAALVITYQRQVGTSLIWLGETLTGKTKASTAVPDKPERAVVPTPAANEKDASADASSPDPSTAASKTSEGSPVGSKRDLASMGQVDSPANESLPADTSAAGVDRPESMLERQGAAPAKTEATWSEGDSVESLWGAVQGGSISAEVSLAERFARGAGVNKNCDQAKVLMKAAADRGNREARLRLYEMETGGCR
jgi:PilZ domain